MLIYDVAKSAEHICTLKAVQAKPSIYAEHCVHSNVAVAVDENHDKLNKVCLCRRKDKHNSMRLFESKLYVQSVTTATKERDDNLQMQKACTLTSQETVALISCSVGLCFMYVSKTGRDI